eukprot:313781-Rhodomonas_salina.1
MDAIASLSSLFNCGHSACDPYRSQSALDPSSKAFCIPPDYGLHPPFCFANNIEIGDGHWGQVGLLLDVARVWTTPTVRRMRLRADRASDLEALPSCRVESLKTPSSFSGAK